MLTLEGHSKSVLNQGERLTLRELGRHREPKTHFLTLPPKDDKNGKRFTLLTDQSIDAPEGSRSLDVLFCSRLPLRAGHSAALLSLKLDLSEGTTGSTRLGCKSGAGDVIRLPSSTPSTNYPFDGLSPFFYVEYDVGELADYEFVAIVDRAERKRPGWLVAEFSSRSDSDIRTGIGLGRLLTTGLDVQLPTERPMVTEINVPALHSSLLAYKLRLAKPPCQKTTELFAPLLRQYITEPHESKYFVNVKEADINLHGVAPYMPPHHRGRSATQGISFQLWSDPTCATPATLSLRVDLLGSMGKLAMRYRTVFAAFPLLVVAVVLRKQFKLYDQTGMDLSVMGVFRRYEYYF